MRKVLFILLTSIIPTLGFSIDKLKQADEVYSIILKLNRAEKLHLKKEFELAIKSLNKIINKSFPSTDVFKAYQAYIGRKDRDSFNHFIVKFNNYHQSLKAKKNE